MRSFSRDALHAAVELTSHTEFASWSSGLSCRNLKALMHTSPDPLPWPQAPHASTVATEARPTLLVAAGEADAATYTIPSYPRTIVHATSAALQSIARERPSVVIVDFDAPTLDGAEICRSCAASPLTSVLVTTANTQTVPGALKAGCHAVLLKPFAPNLLAARLGRLMRERAQQMRFPRLRGAAANTGGGTNRVWSDTACPSCSTLGATSFEFSSHRRMWYACLSCDSVWLGPRQE
jgi:CheY-like chemotaxis protein